jgi:hypothetical protein
VPCSYIAGLLRRDMREEVQRVLQMTPQDFLDSSANLVPRLVLLLELCHRADHLGHGLQETGPAGREHSAHASTCPPQLATRPAQPRTARQQPLWLLDQAIRHSPAAVSLHTQQTAAAAPSSVLGLVNTHPWTSAQPTTSSCRSW